MTPLRRRMIEDMNFAGLSQGTQKTAILVDHLAAMEEDKSKSIFDHEAQQPSSVLPKCPRCNSLNVLLIEVLDRNRSPRSF